MLIFLTVYFLLAPDPVTYPIDSTKYVFTMFKKMSYEVEMFFLFMNKPSVEHIRPCTIMG